MYSGLIVWFFFSQTVCVEKEKSLGGTCLNVGCIPSKVGWKKIKEKCCIPVYHRSMIYFPLLIKLNVIAEHDVEIKLKGDPNKQQIIHYYNVDIIFNCVKCHWLYLTNMGYIWKDVLHTLED